MAMEGGASVSSRLSAISISPKLEDNAAAPGLASSSPSPSKDLSEKKSEGVQKGIAAGDISSPRKSWKNPKRDILSPLQKGEVGYLEEPISAWPLPSCDGISKKKQPLGRRQEELNYNADLQGKERNQIDFPEGPLPLNDISGAVHPPLLPAPRPQRERPLARNPRRGRIQNHHHFNPNLDNIDYSRNHQQQRPRHPLKPHIPFHQQPNQPFNNTIYHPTEHPMTNFPYFSPDWGFNSVPIPQWIPNLVPSASYFVNPAPSQDTMLLYGYLPGPPYIDGFPYHAHPISPQMPLPPVWNQPGLQISLSPPAKATLGEPLENYQSQDNDVYDKLRRQIEYYFSDENLMKDGYLKQCMDDQGWINVHTIAMFPRVQVLTSEVDVVMAALQHSSSVEVSGGKMRRRGEWSKWTLLRGPAMVNDQ